jgi:hypothetical protein
MSELNARTVTVEPEVLTVVDDTYGRVLGPWCAPVEFEELG